MNSRLFIITGLCFSLLLISGLPKGGAAEKASYVIGGTGVTTGNYAYWGSLNAEAETFTVKQWNERGGIKGFPIRYLPTDDEGKPDRALTISKRLVTKDNVLAIVAGPLTASVTAQLPYLTDVGVPFIHSAGGKSFDLPKDRWMFGSTPNTPILINSRLRYLKSRGITKVALICDNTALGEEMAAYTPEAAKREGAELVAISRFDLQEMDMTASLARVKAKSPGGIILNAAGDAAVRNVRQLKQIGVDVPMLLPVAIVDDVFIRNLGELSAGKTNVYADGNWVMVFDDIPDSDARKMKAMEFVRPFLKEVGKKKFNYANALGHDKMETILRAIEAVAPPADKIDYNNAEQLKKIREDIRTWIENRKGLELITGTFSRSPMDHIGMLDLGVVQVVDGKWVLVK